MRRLAGTKARGVGVSIPDVGSEAGLLKVDVTGGGRTIVADSMVVAAKQHCASVLTASPLTSEPVLAGGGQCRPLLSAATAGKRKTSNGSRKSRS